MANIGNLKVTMTGDSKEFTDSVQRAKDSMSSMSDTMSRGVDKMRDSIRSLNGDTGKMSDALFALASGPAAFAAAVSAAATSILFNNIEMYKTFRELNAETGITVEVLGGLAKVASKVGMNTEDLSSILVKYNKDMFEVVKGNKEVIDSYTSIGVDIVKASKEADHGLMTVSKALGNYKDDLNKGAWMQDRFGRSGYVMNALLRELADTTELSSNKTTRAMEEAIKFDRALQDLKRSVGSVSNELGTPLVTALNKIISDVKSAAAQAKPYWDKLLGIGIKPQTLLGGMPLAYAATSYAINASKDNVSQRTSSGKFPGYDPNKDPSKPSIDVTPPPKADKTPKQPKDKTTDEQRLYEKILEAEQRMTTDLIYDTDQLTAAQKELLKFQNDKAWGKLSEVQRKEAEEKLGNISASQLQQKQEKDALKTFEEASKKVQALKDEETIAINKTSSVQEYFNKLLEDEKFKSLVGSERVQKLAEEAKAIETNIQKQKELNALREKVNAYMSETPAGKSDQIKKLQDEFGTAWNEGMFKKEGDASPEEAGKRYADAFEIAKAKITDTKKQTYDLSTAVDNAARSMTDSFIQFAATGKASFKDFASSIIGDLAKMIIQQSIFNALKAGMNAMAGSSTGWVASLGKAFGGTVASANGNVFQNGSLQAFANGGIVGSPTYFPMRNGTGLMGEAGPEAIMPLTRINGKLGVVAQGGGGGVVINGGINVTVQGGQTNEQTGYAVQEAIVRALARQEIANAGRIGGINNPVSIRGI